MNRINNRSDSKWSLWACTAIAALFGLALLLWPGLTKEIIMLLAGGVLIAIGGLSIARYFLRKSPYIAYDYALGTGISCVAAGILAIIFRGILIDMLFTLFGLGLLLGGILKLQLAFNLRRILYPRWYLHLIGAAVSCLLGVLVIVQPGAIADIIVRFIGASILVETVQDILAYFQYNRVIRTRFVD